MTTTTIQLNNDTRDQLKRYGHKGESYDDILKRLMNYCEEMNLEDIIDERWNRLQKEKKQYRSLDEI